MPGKLGEWHVGKTLAQRLKIWKHDQDLAKGFLSPLAHA